VKYKILVILAVAISVTVSVLVEIEKYEILKLVNQINAHY
jgi:hypothetical protein